MTQNSLPGPKMIYIPGGTYRMGERDYVDVKVRDFLMDETPVTVAQYHEAVRAGAVSPPQNSCDSNYFFYNKINKMYTGERKNHPINCIDWYQASTYAEWAGKRLPTEEEWEWAARGGAEGRTYPWGGAEHLPRNQLCWNGPGNGLGEGNRTSTSPVGSYPKGNSKHGLKDMAGNVWEFTSSTYGLFAEIVIIRGSDFSNFQLEKVLSKNRGFLKITQHQINVGFRCVRSV